MSFKSKKKMIIIGIAISIIATIGVLFFTVDHNTLEYLKKINIFWLILASIINILALFVWGFRTKILVNALGGNITLFKATKIVISSFLFAAITPSNIGGEPFRIHLLHKNGLSLTDATIVIIGGRLMGATFFIIALIVAIFLLPGDFINNNEQLKIIFNTLLIILFFSIFIFLYSLFYLNNFKKMFFPPINQIAKFIKKEKEGTFLIKKLDLILDNFNKSIKILFSKNKLSLLIAFFSTILLWLMTFSIPSFLLLGLGQDPIWLTSMLLQVILHIIMLIPITPGGTGVSEIGFTSLYSIYVITPIIPILMVLWRFLTFHSVVAISAIINLKMLKDKELT